MRYIIVFIIPLMCLSCKNNHDQKHKEHSHDHKHNHGDANEHMHQSSFEDLVNNFESSDRAEWQKPEEVLDFIGDWLGKTVMDIGSGTGYFSFRMADRGATVICADVDERFLEYIDEKKKKMNVSDAVLVTRKVPYDSPDLSSGEVDMVITVNTYHHFEDRKDYFSKVKAGIKAGGKLIVIDFKKEETPVGPPVDMKLSAQEIADELRNAGFSDVSVNSDLLPYQNIITAM